jgi:hypothetical protein
MFEFINQYSFEITAAACAIGLGTIFLEAFWRAATSDLVASEKWIISKLATIADKDLRTLVKERLIDHTGLHEKVLTRADYKEIYRKSRANILAMRQNAALAKIS